VSGMAVPRRGLTIVKLGGSFALSPDLPGILDVIGGAVTPVVLVAGGGPFADAVRDAQPRMGFHDRAAHKMALMAMAQFAEALAALSPRLRPARDLAAIRAALGAGAVPVWSPWPMADGLEHLPESWQLTSDSLAAWLAGRLGAECLAMLKRGDAPASLAEAAAHGIVDPLFPDYAEASGATIRWVAPAQPGALAAMLSADIRERLSA
jgi:5-(aminomethyl)-3-furanmethanol phosphate kinase